jgi:hypothetical protein
MSTGVVVARFEEDVEWVKEIEHKVYLYNKGSSSVLNEIKLSNVGRESQTYLHHIVTNYYNLDDITIFLQGDPHEHGLSDNFFNMESFNTAEYINDFTPFLRRMDNYCYLHEDPNQACNMFENSSVTFTFKEFAAEHGLKNLKDIETIEFVQGAQFAVHRHAIQRTKLDVYKRFLETMSKKENEFCGHIMERLWKYFFSH